MLIEFVRREEKERKKEKGSRQLNVSSLFHMDQVECRETERSLIINDQISVCISSRFRLIEEQENNL